MSTNRSSLCHGTHIQTRRETRSGDTPDPPGIVDETPTLVTFQEPRVGVPPMSVLEGGSSTTRWTSRVVVTSECLVWSPHPDTRPRCVFWSSYLSSHTGDLGQSSCPTESSL